jgi:hypothetical protein
MPTKVAKNSFQEGMDKDTDPKQVKQTKMSDAYNVSLSQDNREQQVATYYGAKKLSLTAGTETLAASVADHSDIHVRGTYEAMYLIGTTEALQVE